MKVKREKAANQYPESRLSFVCYTIPLNAKNARDNSPAVTRPMEVSCNGLGTLARRIRSRTPANKTRARPKPTAYAVEETSVSTNVYSSLILIRHTP